jgi:DNA invertase Pin-like site-specific DNA recombinase
MAKTRFLALARVSSREQEREGFSLDIQEDALKREAERRHGIIIKLWRIAETASKKDERKTFKELIVYAKQYAAELDGILFYKIDRAARNLFDYVELERLESEFGVPFFSVTQPTENTPSGRMQRRMLASMASFYTEQQSLDVMEGVKRRVECGLFPQKAPYGYRNLRVDRRGLVEVDPVNGPKITKLFHMHAYEQLTLDGLRDRLYHVGILYSESCPRFPRSKLYAILRDRSYLGDVKFRGDWHAGTHPPLVDQVTWDRVQVLLGGKVYRSHDLTYAGDLIRCKHCGHTVTGESVIKKSTGKEYVYYRCAVYNAPDHPRVRLSEDKLDRQHLSIFDKLRIQSDGHREWFLRQIRNRTANQREGEQERASEVARQLSLILQQRDVLLNMRLNGEVCADAYAVKEAELREREIRLQAMTTESVRRCEVEMPSNAFDLSQCLHEKWAAANRSMKRRIVRAISMKLQLAEAEVIPSPVKPLDVLYGGSMAVRSAHKINTDGEATNSTGRRYGAALAGVPSWITPDEIAEAIRVWRSGYQQSLTPEDALEIILNVRALFDVLFPLK